MKKKVIIWIVVIAVVIIAILLYTHYTPVWVSISTVIFVAAAVVVGWIGHILYNKYIK